MSCGGAAVVAPSTLTVTCHSSPRRHWDRRYRLYGLGFPGVVFPKRWRTLRARWGTRVLGRSSPEDICPVCPGGYVARVIVDVMLKPEIHDPQGEAILGACQRLGYGKVRSVRQGKRFEVETEGEIDEAALAAIRALAHDLLANPVIEDFTLHEA